MPRVPKRLWETKKNASRAGKYTSDPASDGKGAIGMMGALDLNLLAKYKPGEIDAPFIASMSKPPIHSGLFKTSLDLTSGAEGASENILALGSKKYTLLTFAPALSCYYGSGASGKFTVGTKIAGFTIQVEQNEGTKVLYRDGYDTQARPLSMQELYGSDATSIAEAGMVWASKIKLSLVAPAANITGTYH